MTANDSAGRAYVRVVGNTAHIEGGDGVILARVVGAGTRRTRARVASGWTVSVGRLTTFKQRLRRLAHERRAHPLVRFDSETGERTVLTRRGRVTIDAAPDYGPSPLRRAYRAWRTTR